MLLEAIYEPTFSGRSHGFRPKRSCHTALPQIKDTFTGVRWMVEGDIKACFDCFDHHVLIGTYNPDRAVFLTRNGEEKLYFILETKGTTNLFNLSSPERLKIHCGRKHFEALDGVEMWPEPVTDWRGIKGKLQVR